MRKGDTNVECHLPFLTPDLFLQESFLHLCESTHLHHSKFPAQQSTQTVLISNSSWGDRGRPRDPRAVRKHGVTLKTALLKIEGHKSVKN